MTAPPRFPDRHIVALAATSGTVLLATLVVYAVTTIWSGLWGVITAAVLLVLLAALLAAGFAAAGEPTHARHRLNRDSGALDRWWTT